MSAETLLPRFDRVRKRGPGQWSARCPAHEDKGPSLSIRETPEGVLLLHCFAGCEAADVVAAVGIDLADLFPPKTNGAPPLKRRALLSDSQALDLLHNESQFVALCGANIGHGVELSPDDRARCLHAAGRIMSRADEAIREFDARVAATGGPDAAVARLAVQALRAVGKSNGAQKDTACDDGVILVQASTLKPEAVAWLWLHWLALGKLHILAGPPGQGKTTIALACAATVSAGGRWPDGSRCASGNVLIWSGEDDARDTLLPRLIAMGADVKRVYFIEGTRIGNKPEPFDPARDLVQLSAKAEAIGDVRLLIVDPVVSAVTGDSHKNTEVRRALQPLVDLASCLGAAVLGISHFSKASAGREPVERVTGSLAFGAVARVVLCAVRVKDMDGDRRILARAKSNIGPDDGGFEYSIEQTTLPEHPSITASAILWGQALAGTARELLAEAEAEPENDDGSSIAGVDGFLRGLLANGPVPAKSIKADADGAGYAWRTVQLSATRLGVERRKEGMKGGWVWALVPVDQSRRRSEGAEDATQIHLAPSAPSAASSGDAEAF
jgi:putative DNA primase/helicase